MSESQDYYELLGVQPTASGAEIKSAFRRLAQQYHPDRGGEIPPEDVERFKRITEAYRILTNADARNSYNKEHGHKFYEEVQIGGVGGQQGVEESKGDEAVEIASVERDFNALHRMAGNNNDLKVNHKVAQTDEEELQRLQEEESDVAAWGDLETAPVSGGILSNLLSGRRRGSTSQRRSELKKNFKRTMKEESIPRRPSMSFTTPESDSPGPNVERSEEKLVDPLRNERRYVFQISALEAALGTTREVVLPSNKEDHISKLEVEIPAGVTSGTVVEVARGWDRAEAEIRVSQDSDFQVKEQDIYMRVPISLKEALDGASINIPGIKNIHQVKLRAGAAALEQLTLEGAGISGKGNIYVQAFIVPPQQSSSTLAAAAQAVDAHYDGEDIRADFLANPLSETHSITGEGKITFFLPIRLSEALSGVEVGINIKGHPVTLVVPSNWHLKKEIYTSACQEQLGVVLYVEPYIAMPKRISADLQGAALAIEQHFLASPRSQLPKKLSK